MDWSKFTTPTEISDEQLGEAISAKNVEGSVPNVQRRIQAVIRDFTAWPGDSFRKIPQARRWEFLGRIGKIGSRLRKQA
jgi:hypothetical protein